MAAKEKPILFSALMVNAINDGRKSQTRRIVKGMECPDKHNDQWCEREWIDCNNGEWHVGSTSGNSFAPVRCPFGKVGNKLWVRETWADVNTEEGPAILYRADSRVRTWRDFSETFGPDEGAGPSMDYDSYPGDYVMWWEDLLNGEPEHKWKPSIFMPRWACRILLEITDIRVERLHSISEEDAVSEGVPMEYPIEGGWPCPMCGGEGLHGAFGRDYGVIEVDCRACETPVKRFWQLWDSIHGNESWNANHWVWAITFERIT